MPSAETIRDDLLKTAGPEYWRPHGAPDGTPTDFEAAGELGQKALKARLALGPGPNGTPYQKALFDYHAELLQLEKEQARLLDKMDAVSGYDPASGAPISANDSDTQRALRIQIIDVIDRRERLLGPAGKERLEKALTKAVRQVQEQRRQAYITEEAKRRAARQADEDEIERRAAGFRKTQGR